MDLITTEVYSYGGWPKYSLDYGFPLKGDILNFQGDRGTKSYGGWPKYSLDCPPQRGTVDTYVYTYAREASRICEYFYSDKANF